MAVEKSTAGGSLRSFEFVPGPRRRPQMTVQRWLVWYWRDDVWRHAPAPMPEGAAAHYADVAKRDAGAICMEAVNV